MKPFSPDTLADRWGCSSATVRAMIRAGDLDAFRIGRLYRIPWAAVQRVENTALENTGAPSVSSGTKAAGAIDIHLERLTAAKPSD